jgi:hypothetical protein
MVAEEIWKLGEGDTRDFGVFVIALKALYDSILRP